MKILSESSEISWLERLQDDPRFTLSLNRMRSIRELQAANFDVPFALLVSGNSPVLYRRAKHAGIVHIYRKPLTNTPDLLGFIQTQTRVVTFGKRGYAHPGHAL